MSEQHHIPQRIIFMGTPSFSVEALQILINSPHEVIAVYTRPPTPRDRGHHVQKSPVHIRAEEHNIHVYTPKSLRNEDEQLFFKSLNADLAVVAAYGLILPLAILEAPRLGCVNLHASLLPRWRGAAPIQRAIMAEDEETGITLMQMDIGLDTGAMLAKSYLPITSETTTPVLHDQLATSGAALLRDSLNGLLEQAIIAIPQPTEGVTYAAKLEKAEGQLNWNEPATALHAHVRALNPWPGTWFSVEGVTIKVLAADIIVDHSFEPGVFFSTDDHALCVACTKGSLALKIVQRSGGKPMNAHAFLQGFPALLESLKIIQIQNNSTALDVNREIAYK
ncbi:MAG: methionyl-tRNA formyltransferase [Pseudomonadota bacterium]